MTSVSADRQAYAEASISIAWSDLDNSVIPFNQSPKVDLTWFLCRTVPLQKVSFMLFGSVLKANRVLVIKSEYAVFIRVATKFSKIR